MNIGETKVMRCQVRIGQAEESGKYPCGVCRQGVGDNSIKCVACHKWIHAMTEKRPFYPEMFEHMGWTEPMNQIIL